MGKGHTELGQSMPFIATVISLVLIFLASTFMARMDDQTAPVPVGRLTPPHLSSPLAPAVLKADGRGLFEDRERNALSYRWVITREAEEVAVVESPDIAVPLEKPGLYEIILTVSLDGTEADYSRKFQVTLGSNRQPMAVIDGLPQPPQGTVPLPLVLDAGTSLDPEGAALTYRWQLIRRRTKGGAGDDDGAAAVGEIVAIGRESRFTPQIDLPGQYEVQLSVSDGLSVPKTVVAPIVAWPAATADGSEVGRPTGTLPAGTLPARTLGAPQPDGLPRIALTGIPSIPVERNTGLVLQAKVTPAAAARDLLWTVNGESVGKEAGGKQAGGEEGAGEAAPGEEGTEGARIERDPDAGESRLHYLFRYAGDHVVKVALPLADGPDGTPREVAVNATVTVRRPVVRVADSPLHLEYDWTFIDPAARLRLPAHLVTHGHSLTIQVEELISEDTRIETGFVTDSAARPAGIPGDPGANPTPSNDGPGTAGPGTAGPGTIGPPGANGQPGRPGTRGGPGLAGKIPGAVSLKAKRLVGHLSIDNSGGAGGAGGPGGKGGVGGKGQRGQASFSFLFLCFNNAGWGGTGGNGGSGGAGGPGGPGGNAGPVTVSADTMTGPLEIRALGGPGGPGGAGGAGGPGGFGGAEGRLSGLCGAANRNGANGLTGNPGPAGVAGPVGLPARITVSHGGEWQETQGGSVHVSPTLRTD